MYDDELIGMEDVQEFELELLRKRREEHQPEHGMILESAVFVQADTFSNSDESDDKTAAAVMMAAPNDSDSDSTPNAEHFNRSERVTGSQQISQQSGRYSILSEKLMDERRYVALMKSIEDLQYREQLFKEYGIAPTDTT